MKTLTLLTALSLAACSTVPKPQNRTIEARGQIVAIYPSLGCNQALVDLQDGDDTTYRIELRRMISTQTYLGMFALIKTETDESGCVVSESIQNLIGTYPK